MMKVKVFTFNPVRENTYLIWDEDTLDAAVIDAGMYDAAECRDFADFVRSQGLRLSLSLQTHSHYDHIFGLPFVFSEFGLRPHFHADEETLYYAMPKWAKYMGVDIKESLPRPQKLFADGERVALGTIGIEVLHTPGHTPGGVCYYIEKEGALFSGDTLFRGSVGRTDLPGGNQHDEMCAIAEKLLPLPPQTKVWPGHGDSTTLGLEANSNPYLQRLRR